jgi:hypothetical protein
MRKLLPLVAFLVASVAPWAIADATAPGQKAPEVPAIDGTYILNSSSLPTTSTKAAKGVKGEKGNTWNTTTTTGFPRTARSATIAKNEIHISGQSWPMTYTIDPTKTPMAIDVTTLDERNKPTKSLGVIEIGDNNRITIALARPGNDRPRTTAEGEGVTLYYFQKAPPPPRTEYRIVALSVGKEAEAEKELNKLLNDGYELVNTTNPLAPDPKSSVTTVHFILKRTVGQP